MAKDVLTHRFTKILDLLSNKTLLNLASATESSHTTNPDLTAANALLTTQLANATATLATITRELTLLRATTPTYPNRSFQCNAPRSLRRFHNKNYCYTCGWDVPD